MLFSCLVNISAKTDDVTIKDGKIHMDADNGKTAFLWGYGITYLNGQAISTRLPCRAKTNIHDEYYNIPSTQKMTVEISIRPSIGQWDLYYIRYIDARACGFKVYGTTGHQKINFNYYQNGIQYKGDDYLTRFEHMGWGSSSKNSPKYVAKLFK